jgi:hypothetical protein
MTLARVFKGLATIVAVAVLLPASIAGGAVRGAATAVPTTTGGGVRYPDVAYDAVNNVFLAVTGKKKVQGRFLSPAGALLGSTFDLSASAPYKQAPRVHCGEGVCLVVWHEGDDGTVPMARIVSYTGGLVSAPIALGAKGSMWERGAGIAYSPAANQFLVTWEGSGAAHNIWIARVNLAGQLLGNLALTTTSAYEREPSVAYNPASGEFIVVYAGTTQVNGVETAYVSAQRVKDGAPVGGPIKLDSSKVTYISWAEYNPETRSVLAAWSRGSTKIYGRAISSTGAIGSLLALSTSYGAYDALDVSFNPVSQSFLLVTHGSTVEDVGIELSSSYSPSAAFLLTANGGTGNFNPRVASSTASARWMAVTAKSFATLIAQSATSAPGVGADGGGGGGGGGSANPVLTSLTSNPSPPFTAGNAVTFTATATGGTATREYAFWLYNRGTAAWTLARPYSGSSQFTWSAAPGTYNVQVWVRNVGSALSSQDALSTATFTVMNASGAPTLTSLTSNRNFPVAPGTSVTWTANATGSAALEYAFWIYNQSSRAWTLARSYSPNNQFTWPAALGAYNLQVWVRNVGSAASSQDALSTATFTVINNPPQYLGMTSSVPLPAKANTAITFRIQASGSLPLQYQFWLYNAGTNTWKSLCGSYMSTNACTWIAKAGTYRLQGWVRNQGSTSSSDDSGESGMFQIEN